MARENIGADDFSTGANPTLDLSVIPAVVTLKNNGTKKLMISISGMNQSLPIEAGQTIKLLAESSSELIGYLSQETAELDVTFAAKTAASNG